MPRDVTVTATAPVYDTEVRERVLGAIQNLLPGGELVEVRDRDRLRYGEEVVVEGRGVERLRELVERQEIAPTTRRALREGAVGDAIQVRLKKQAAGVGRLNLDVGGHELGAIDLRIATDDVDATIDRIAPREDEDG